jgi:gliding motility-associated-like protein
MNKFLALFIAFILMLSGVGVSAQTYVQVTQLAPGSQVVNGVNVSVSAIGATTTYPSGYCGMTNGPNPLPWIGQSGTSSYHYAFSVPVWGVRVRQLSLNVGEHLQLNTNGTMYYLQPAMAQSYPNTCNEPFGYVNNGFFMPPSPYGQGEIEITPGNINDFELICQNGNSGVVFTVELIFPDVDANNNGPLCAGDMLILDGSASNTNLTFSWTGPNGFTSSQLDDTIHNAAVTHSGWYYLTGTDGVNTWIDSTLVVVNPIPVISNFLFTNPGPCDLTDGTITLQGLTPNTAYTVDYLFNNNPVTANLSSNASGDLLINNLASGLYTLITVTLNGCTSPPVGPVTLTNAPLVAPSVGSNSPVCENGVITLSANSYPGASYNWTGPNSFTSTQQNPSISPATLADAGTYTVTATISTCTTPPASVTVDVRALPAAPATEDISYCQNDVVPPLNAQGVNLLWHHVPTGGTGLQTLTPPTNIPGSTTYYVSQTFNGCEGPRSPLTVTVNPIITLDLQASRPTICIDDTVVVFNTTTPPVGSSYTWEFSGGAVQNGSGNSPHVISWNTYGNKTVSLMVTDNVCTAYETVDVFVDTPMHPFFDIYGHVCVGEEIVLPMAEYDGHNPPVYDWNFDGATVHRGSGLGDYVLSWNTDGTKTIELDIPGICPEHFSDVIDVHTPPVAEIAGATPNPVCEGGLVKLTAVDHPGIAAFKWRNDEFYDFNNSPFAEANIIESGWIVLGAMDDYGCTGYDSIYVESKACCNVFVPSVFSPNGDGKNDIFRPRTEGFQHYTTFLVMNRWGQKVFESTSPGNGWDGTFKGVPQDPGVYTYQVLYSCGGQMTEKKGDITLVR